MNSELKSRWIMDLRRNPDLKGMGTLRCHDETVAGGAWAEKFCCLGRLLIIVGDADHIDDLQNRGYEEFDWDHLMYFDITNEQHDDLIELNDNNESWEPVIDYIEANL